MSLLLALTGLSLLPSAAQAAPVYQITGRWEAGTPTTVAKGDVVTAVWRVNVNDDQAAPANEPVDNVTFTVTAQHALFKSLPDACVTAGATPASSISADGRTLTCNLGTVKEGTAVVVQAPMTVDGDTGDQVAATGTIAGQTADVPPLDIVNPFGMDIAWGSSTNTVTYNADSVDTDLEWTLFLNAGSSPGPASVTYHLNVTTGTGAALAVAPDACSAFTTGGASGHPWSGGTHPAAQTAPIVGSCTLTQTGANTFDLTLSGIDYSQAQVPTQDSVGQSLPTNQVAVASGSVWFRITGTQNDSIRLSSSAPTYSAPTGGSANDDASNNTSDKVWTRGGWSNAYRPEFSNVQVPSWWSNQFRVSPGTLVDATTDVSFGTGGYAGTDTFAQCVIMDTKYVTFHDAQFSYNWAGYAPNSFLQGSTVEYYVGTSQYVDPANPNYDPNSFACADDPAGWTTTAPSDLSTVKAVRVTYPFSVIEGSNNSPLMVHFTVNPSTPVGTDVWEFGEVAHNGVWVRPSRTLDPADGPVPTSGKRYPYVGSGRDVLYVIGAIPAVSKSVDRSTLKPGVPATYTLSYSANGTGAIPPTVDDYQLVDTLPVGMTYVAGSATPEPAVSTNGSGQEVLTWTLDGVPTNTPQTLTYRAIADSSVTPGQRLTNSVTASVGGQTSSPATAQVTVSTNGYTQIAKTADTPFIPNTDGKGNGAGSWTVSVRSFDPLPQAYTDVIDILPYRGDGRGTSYSGSYDLSGVDALAGQTVYYTDADPATLSDDPNATANGAANAPSGLWSTTMPAHPTAVRVIGPGLAPGAEQQFRINVTTHGAAGGDVYVNRAQGVAGHTELVMRTSAPMSVANYYSAALKKYVQDVKGAWHDANDVADYPAFRYGDVIRYRIVVTNTGQGTLHHVVVADDKQPALGGFSIDSLDPGKSESHEYSITLTKSVSGTVVNTATASADTPPDSQIPPTINSDPAGFEVANYATVKSAVPASGSALVPGQRVTYTVKVAQQGSAPAVASFTDDLAKVLDDATYNGDAKASIGKVSYANAHLVWSGTIPVGQVAVVTYSVTVKAVQHLGDRGLVNSVTSDGCAGVCSTRHQVARFDLKITKKVIGAKQVAVGHKVRYGLRVVNRGPDAAPGPIRVGDKLPKGLKLRAAHGSGWSCVVAKATRKVSCVRAAALAPGAKAPVITVVAKATKAAIGHRLVNTATVKAAGDTVRSNNHSKAAIRVIKKAPMWVPYNSYRLVPRERWLA
jgi:uncharacterized repeat protein (TIGR01451 family)